jgi:hypothetical protein
VKLLPKDRENRSTFLCGDLPRGSDTQGCGHFIKGLGDWVVGDGRAESVDTMNYSG